MSKTIREIPNCGAPAGCSSVVIVLWKERSASGEHQGKKITISVQKGPEKQRFFTGSGKVQENLFHLHTKTILAWLFPLEAFSYKDMG